MADTPPRRTRRRSSRPTLTAREVRFCRQYAEHGNITRAVKEAGFEFSSDNSAVQYGRKLLRKDQIRDQVREFQQAAVDAARVTVEVVAAGLRADGWADRRGLFGPNGEVLPPSRWPPELAAVVTGVEVDELTEMVPDPDDPRRKKKVTVGSRWKVRTSDRVQARKLLGQWLGMFGEKAVNGGGAAEVEVTRATLPDNGRGD